MRTLCPIFDMLYGRSVRNRNKMTRMLAKQANISCSMARDILFRSTTNTVKSFPVGIAEVQCIDKLIKDAQGVEQSVIDERWQPKTAQQIIEDINTARTKWEGNQNV